MGAAWEQRPALPSADDYYSLNLGSGFSWGKDAEKLIFDFVYIYTFAKDVAGIAPEQTELRSDVSEHQAFVSVIRHF
ncbi:MAG: hypothetical protein GKR87_08280 [Kiritimatiellae bacterium]|nr:hypothetical protein [Kiritimatiellia bacterium]